MNDIYKFTGDTTVVGQISNNDKSKYRREIEGSVTWCNENNLSLNVSKTEELITDFRKKGGEHTPIYINRTEVERVESVKFLGVMINNTLDQDHKKRHKMVCTAQTITEANFPSMDSIYMARCHRKVANIIKDAP
eukprot:g31150.t1